MSTTRPVKRGPRCLSAPADDDGFTLVELLVVIIILGILSAVVVFAVRGSDDKGVKAAKSADRRTLRTAQEAFCAQYGKYATSEAELVDPSLAGAPAGTKGFLSEESELHDIEPVLAVSGDPKPCGGTGYRIIDLGSSPDPDVPCGGPEVWCPTESPPAAIYNAWGPTTMVQLTSGRVFALTGNTALLYDPGSEEWIDGPDIDAVTRGFGHGPSMQLLVDDPSTVTSECASGSVDNCGKVLVLLGGSALVANRYPSEWYLYDPEDGQTGAWEKVLGTYQPHYALRTRTMQIKGSQCGTHCGKVLIVGQSEVREPQQLPIVELFDPKTNTLGVTGPPAATAAGIYHPDPLGGPGSWDSVASCSPLPDSEDPGCYVLASLADGSVLATAGTAGIFRFDPVNGWRMTGSTNYSGTRSGVLLDRHTGIHRNKVLGVGIERAGAVWVNVAELYTP